MEANRLQVEESSAGPTRSLDLSDVQAVLSRITGALRPAARSASSESAAQSKK
jgi:predicted MarR family transcription regulator